jgi:hypothetical protein
MEVVICGISIYNTACIVVVDTSGGARKCVEKVWRTQGKS